MNRDRVGIIAILAGVGACAGGIAVYLRSRNSSLGRMVSQTKADGMTLTHYRSASMPIKERIGHIQDMVWAGVQDPRMRKLALKITKHCPSRDGDCEARAVFDYVYKNVRYTGDVAPVKMGRNGPVEGVDYFPSARRVLEFGAEDCDGHNITLATLLALNGITPRMRVTAPTKSAPFQHIYTVAGLPKNRPTSWKALDTTLPNPKYGYELAYGRKQDFPA